VGAACSQQLTFFDSVTLIILGEHGKYEEFLNVIPYTLKDTLLS
jgi:hypothetical protein